MCSFPNNTFILVAEGAFWEMSEGAFWETREYATPSQGISS